MTASLWLSAEAIWLSTSGSNAKSGRWHRQVAAGGGRCRRGRSKRGRRGVDGWMAGRENFAEVPDLRKRPVKDRMFRKIRGIAGAFSTWSRLIWRHLRWLRTRKRDADMLMMAVLDVVPNPISDRLVLQVEPHHRYRRWGTCCAGDSTAWRGLLTMQRSRPRLAHRRHQSRSASTCLSWFGSQPVSAEG